MGRRQPGSTRTDARFPNTTLCRSRALHEGRHPTTRFTIGGFERRPGKRLLTIGADCTVGKMYTALALERELRARSVAADFRATGQTGLLIAGSGVAVDAGVSDFVAAAGAPSPPPAAGTPWDLEAGQEGGAGRREEGAQYVETTGGGVPVKK